MPSLREAVIVEAVRSPIGKRNGSLAGIHPVDLLATVLQEAVTRAGVNPFGNMLVTRYEGKLVPQGISAELIATKWGLTRDQMDDFSYRSHLKAAKATTEGYFRREILPIKVEGNGTDLLEQDEGIRFDPDRAKMSTLQPSFQAEHFEQMFPGQINWS